MPRDGFRSGDIVNRRVNSHIKSLLPSALSTDKDYHLEGQRFLDPEHIPGKADSCLCYLEAYVGTKGRFEIVTTRRFDHETESEWRAMNRISRKATAQGRSLEPFEYGVRTRVEFAEHSHSDRSRVDWEALGDDPIFGGREAQAAALLAEKMAHLKSCRGSEDRTHHGSLSYLGSLSNVIGNSSKLQTDWTAVDELLGPDADTIAASTDFEPLESDERRRNAREMGIDFLSETLENDLGRFERDSNPESNERDDTDRREAWQTLPADMDATKAKAKLDEMQEELAEMRDDF